MANSVEIPLDIIYNVIAAVGDDTHVLKQCALVSSSFLLPCRKQLFSRITLSCDQCCQDIHQVFVRNPVIQSFVRTITLTQIVHWGTCNFPDWMNSTSLLAILRLPFCRLESFSICGCHLNSSWNWDTFSSELKDALSNIIHSSTLKTLSLEDVTKVPITFFLGIIHLTTLELSLSPNDFCDENLISLTSKGVAPIVVPVPVIDRCVWNLPMIEEESEHGPTKLLFLPFMCRLRFFEINVRFGFENWHDFDILSFLMVSLCINLTSPATLEHLKFNISFGAPDYDFTYEEEEFYEDLRDADAWRHVDSIISHPAGSRLQRVDVNINCSIRYSDDNPLEHDENEVLNAVLDGLPLLRTKGILFVEAFSE